LKAMQKRMERKLIFFDLEGPLSPQDNAYEVMRTHLGAEGAKIFERISKYDDIISLEGCEGYEPGDTLALLVPFLLAHGITAEDIRKVSEQAGLVSGSRFLCDKLRERGWKIYIISTSYEQHALNIGEKLGIPAENVVCTKLNLDERRKEMSEKVFALVHKYEQEILEMPLTEEGSLKRLCERLDALFFEELPAVGFEVFETKVVGGERKASALREIAEREGVALEDVIAVGDSITDFKMLDAVRRSGGLAVVFNGNEYAVPYASVGLASTDIRFLLILCDAFAAGGKKEALDVASAWEERGDAFRREPESIPERFIPNELLAFIKTPFFFHNIERADERKKKEIVSIHKDFRVRVRKSAGLLG